MAWFILGAWAAVIVLCVSIAVGWMVTDMRIAWKAWRASRALPEEIDPMEEMDLFAAADAAAARDAALEQVAANNKDWMARAMTAFSALPAGMEMTGEILRQHVGDAVGQPKHPNAWGAFTNALIRRGLLVPTGEYRPMTGAKSNARKTPVHVKVAA